MATREGLLMNYAQFEEAMDYLRMLYIVGRDELDDDRCNRAKKLINELEDEYPDYTRVYAIELARQAL